MAASIRMALAFALSTVVGTGASLAQQALRVDVALQLGPDGEETAQFVVAELSKLPGARLQLVTTKTPAANLLEMVRQGAVDVAAASVTDFGYPLDLASLPAACTNAAGLANALQKGLRQALQKELELRQPAYQYLAIWPVTTWGLATRADNFPKTVADLKGRKLRIPPVPAFTALAQNLGTSSTAIAFAEVVVALNQGAIDGGFFTLSFAARAFSDNIALSDAPGTGVPVAALVANRDKWRALPNNTRTALQASLPGLEQRLFQRERTQRQAFLEIARKKGVRLVPPPQGMKSAVLGATQQVEKTYVERNPQAVPLINLARVSMKVAGGACQTCPQQGQCPCQNDPSRCSTDCTDCCN